MIVLIDGSRRYGVRVSPWRQFILASILLAVCVFCARGFVGALAERLPRDAAIYATIAVICAGLGLGAAINGWRALAAYGRAVFR